MRFVLIVLGIIIGYLGYFIYSNRAQFESSMWIFCFIVATVLIILGLAYKVLLITSNKLQKIVLKLLDATVKIQYRIIQLAGIDLTETKIFHPSIFNDPVAENIGWEPLQKGGFGIFIHRLTKINPRIYIFRINKMGIFIPAVTMAIGTALFLRVLLDYGIWFVELPIAVLFFLFGFLTYRYWSVNRYFDLNLGYYWKGRKTPEINSFQSTNLQCKISDIHALQIISEFCNGGRNSESSYLSYELNLVLTDKSRINVIDHTHRLLLQEDAEQLSKILNVPVWDATLEDENNKYIERSTNLTNYKRNTME